jgi:hypothetical protein
MGVWMYHEKCSIQFTSQNGDWRGITLKFQLSLLVRMLHIIFFLFSILWLGIHNLFISFTMIIKLIEMGRVSFGVMGHK